MNSQEIYLSLLRACNAFKDEGVLPAVNLCWVAAFRMIPDGELSNHAWIETLYPDDEPGEYDTWYDLLVIGTDKLNACIPVPMLAEKVVEACYQQCIRVPRREHDRQVDPTRKASMPDEVSIIIERLSRRWNDLHEVLTAEAIARSALGPFYFYDLEEANRLLSRMNELVGGFAIQEQIVESPFVETFLSWRVQKTL